MRWGRGGLAGVGVLAAVLAVTAAAAQSDRPTIGDLVPDEPPRREGQLFTPERGPFPLPEAATAPTPGGAPVKAAVYVPECASPAAPADHVAYLQSLGLAVAVPALGGDRCAQPREHLGTLHDEIERVAGELAALEWIDGDALYLVGHGVGADVVATFTSEGVFVGMVGFAAACPFGIQNVTPILTFRTLDDPVLRNRGTRCSQFDAPNAVNVEFGGSEHVLRLSPQAAGGAEVRALMRRTLRTFLGVTEGEGEGLSDGDQLDLRQLGDGG
ncbi:MAG: hypothetical protein GVY33_12840 [Alphaproteobacteria bacterium]|nr:hypothetical protein [Alphaproteobacteria bacterium]